MHGKLPNDLPNSIKVMGRQKALWVDQVYVSKGAMGSKGLNTNGNKSQHAYTNTK